MGFILLLFFYLLIFLLWAIIVTLVFPEVALYIIVVLFSMFLPNEIGGRYIELLEFFQPFIQLFSTIYRSASICKIIYSFKHSTELPAVV